MIPQRIEPVFTERYESGESVLSAQVNSVKGVYIHFAYCFKHNQYYNIVPTFHREVRHLQVVEIVVKISA